MKLVITILALALVVAAAMWFQPREYISTTVLRPRAHDPQAQNEAVRYTLSEFTLARIIERQNLYPNERKHTGMAGAIRGMREHGIRIQEGEDVGPVIVLSFRYSNKRQTQATVRELAAALQSELPCEVLVEASEPRAHQSKD